MTYPSLADDDLLDSGNVPQLALHGLFELLPDPRHTHKDGRPHLLKKKRNTQITCLAMLC